MSNRETDFSRLELDLPNCLDNYRYFRSKLERSTRMLVLVKANAYGHGAVEFASMMQNVSDNLKRNFAGWTVWLLTSDRTLPRQMRLKESRKIPLFNGPLECRFFRFDLVSGSFRKDAPAESDAK